MWHAEEMRPGNEGCNWHFLWREEGVLGVFSYLCFAQKCVFAFACWCLKLG